MTSQFTPGQTNQRWDSLTTWHQYTGRPTDNLSWTNTNCVHKVIWMTEGRAERRQNYTRFPNEDIATPQLPTREKSKRRRVWKGGAKGGGHTVEVVRGETEGEETRRPDESVRRLSKEIENTVLPSFSTPDDTPPPTVSRWYHRLLRVSNTTRATVKQAGHTVPLALTSYSRPQSSSWLSTIITPSSCSRNHSARRSTFTSSPIECIPTAGNSPSAQEGTCTDPTCRGQQRKQTRVEWTTNPQFQSDSALLRPATCLLHSHWPRHGAGLQE